MPNENEKPEIIIPSWLLFTVFGIWILAIPLVIFVFTNSKTIQSKPEVLGIEQEMVITETQHEEEKLNLTPTVVIENKEAIGELVVGIPLYTVSICHEEYCQYLDNDDFKTFSTGKSLDREKFNDFLNTHIIPFFEKKYGQKTIVKNSKGEFPAKLEDVEIVYSTIYDKINSSFISGVKNIKIDLDYKISPGTDGKYAEKYIEVDNSQQRLYVWNGGKVEKVILLSGPVYGWQVYGVFPIVDKGREPIAPGGKYMPYWMAFYYSKKQDSWYGLHGLIWKYRDDGSKWFEPVSNIGTRQSAGCIRMVLEDAKYLYERFEKGDLILIHE
jgi:lipoprotein-anchoring transpeptidase ErfK/SrfK